MNNIKKLLDKYPEFISYYWNYQYRLGKEYIVPYFKKSGLSLKGANILEIGAGEGGVLMACAEEGVKKSVGFDLREGVVKSANEIASDLNNPCKFFVYNIYNENIPAEWKNVFDIILMRDVIEHLDNTERNVKQLLEFAHKGSMILITFPPYYSPYGAHQHTLKNLPGKIPFMQLLPDFIFYPLTKSGREADIIEVERLRKITLTIKKFKTAAKNSGLTIIDERLFLLRPVFKIKFGFPIVSSKLLNHLPGLRELLATEASYLLKF